MATIFLKSVFKPWQYHCAIEVLTTAAFSSMPMRKSGLRTLVYQFLISQLRDINLCPLPVVGSLFLLMAKFIITLKCELVCKKPAQHQIGVDIRIPRHFLPALTTGVLNPLFKKQSACLHLLFGTNLHRHSRLPATALVRNRFSTAGKMPLFCLVPNSKPSSVIRLFAAKQIEML